MNRQNCDGKSKTLPQIQGVSKSYSKRRDLKSHLCRAGLYEQKENVLGPPCRVSSRFKRTTGQDCSVPRRRLYLMDDVSYTGFLIAHRSVFMFSVVSWTYKVCMFYLVLKNVDISLLFRRLYSRSSVLFKVTSWLLFLFFSFRKTMHFCHVRRFVD